MRCLSLGKISFTNQNIAVVCRSAHVLAINATTVISHQYCLMIRQHANAVTIRKTLEIIIKPKRKIKYADSKRSNNVPRKFGFINACT